LSLVNVPQNTSSYESLLAPNVQWPRLSYALRSSQFVRVSDYGLVTVGKATCNASITPLVWRPLQVNPTVLSFSFEGEFSKPQAHDIPFIIRLKGKPWISLALNAELMSFNRHENVVECWVLK
jgi:hypothetical protein